MIFESFAAEVGDDGQPSTALDIAARGVRDFNHRTRAHMRIPDAHNILSAAQYAGSNTDEPDEERP